jgi:hypothetical protein
MRAEYRGELLAAGCERDENAKQLRSEVNAKSYARRKP